MCEVARTGHASALRAALLTRTCHAMQCLHLAALPLMPLRRATVAAACDSDLSDTATARILSGVRPALCTAGPQNVQSLLQASLSAQAVTEP